ncbi:MAG: discoidin domain-containing protein [Rhodospirillales bacterium]|nr:discoidin domain-containing protein [Acetobacter sp.]
MAARPCFAFAQENDLLQAGQILAEGAFAPSAQEMAAASFTRGVGMYPGAPAEFFGPEIVPDTSGTYRNLALLRPAYASSSYDYNLTPQLVTDGLVDTRMPEWIVGVVNGQVLPKPDREVMTSHEPVLTAELAGSHPTVELHLGGGEQLPEVDRLVLFVVIPESVDAASLTFTAFLSTDGHTWQQAGSGSGARSEPVNRANYPPDLVRGAQILKPVIAFDGPHRSRYYRVKFASGDEKAESPYASTFRLGQIEFHRGQERVQLGGPYSFTSAWKSAGLDEEWVSVDLGGRFQFDTVKLHWIARAAEGKLQVSDDEHQWRDLQALPGEGQGATDEIKLSTPGEGRYVRLLMSRPATAHGYILSEFEVWGKGGFTARPHAPALARDGRLSLSGGAWKLQRGPQVTAAGEALSTAGFKDTDWIVATVPGTTLTSYLNVGAIPDPNYGQNQLHVSDSFFYADFWYRTEFQAAPGKSGELQWLRFDGLNWKAEVFLNGASLGRVDGAFTRGSFDVTGKLRKGTNALALRVIKNATPGSCKQKTYEKASKNGGGLGADNPTFHASVGWDWISTIRGRNTGIWAEVYLQTTGAATIEDPLVTSKLPLPDVSRADVSLEIFALNHTEKPFSGTLRGKFGDIAVEEHVSLGPQERKAIRLSPDTHKQLSIHSPRLWWPVGYGEPYLYDVDLRLEGRSGVSDRKQFKAGIRQMTATEEGGALKLFINGRRFIAKGGNWGFGESMLRFRAREYDAAVRYHREMNFTMIRNWVGQIGDEAFYEACDRHGVVVWQDFWLANPWDGPIPDDNALFLANARDYIARIRNHASLGLYCGRNEWFPPEPLDKGLRALLAELHPDIHYIGSSADGPVSGHGPYRALPIAEYFRQADTKLHSEIGAPAIPPLASVRAMMPENAMWPLGLDWGLHDFTLDGAQGGEAFVTLVQEAYGGANDAEEWIKLGEIVSYEAYRAMFEAQSVHRMGVLLWMSHPCWPSFVWQTYDFYLAPTSSYFACKKGAEPLHIQWNPVTDSVEVVNYSAGTVSGLVAELEILDLNGRSLAKQAGPVANSSEDSTTSVFAIKYPENVSSSVQMLRLRLLQGETVRSTNFYLRGLEAGDYAGIRTLGRAKLTVTTQTEKAGERVLLRTVVNNASAIPALFVRLEATRAQSGDRVLPAIHEDGYFALLPGESRTLVTEVQRADLRGEEPKIVVDGLNVTTA